MISAGRIIKFIFYISVALLVTRGCFLFYYNVAHKASQDQMPNSLGFNFDKTILEGTSDQNQCKDSYNFNRMLSLIDASEKVKYIEHMQFSRPGEVERVDTQTLKALSIALKLEKKRLKHFMWQLRSHSRHSSPSKRMKALKYYLRVIELNMQDIEEVVFTREDSGELKTTNPKASE
ncbi:MAG: hypothetical protein US49_C0002G0069 [candidate division TM6 bacterium GW2011_GWF2_37_49]|nr:MAG: hypothetical protein US49_C0002G0069 [candidate division TM6 bacterium GW2011_GWF2_37_49]